MYTTMYLFLDILMVPTYFSLVGDSVELARWCSGKESAFQFRRFKRPGFNPWVGKIPLE